MRCPFPQAGWNRGALWAGSWGGKGVAAQLGDRPRGSGGLQAQLSLSGSLVGLWSCAGISCSQGHPVPCYPPATSIGKTTAGACPRILRQVSCLSWAHLPLSTLPLPPPPPLPSATRPRGAKGSEVRGSMQVRLLGGTASLMRQEGGCPR